MLLNFCVYVFVYGFMYMNTYVEAKDSLFLPYFLRQGPLLNTDVAKSMRLAGQGALENLPSQSQPALHWDGSKPATMTSLFTWALGA